MMNIAVVFFDIGETLASARVDPVKGLVLTPLPGIIPLLDSVSGLRLGIISGTGPYRIAAMRAALEGAGLYRFFEGEPSLLIYSAEVGLNKDSPEIFELAANHAAVEAARCLFVGEDASERAFATEAGMQAAASPADVPRLIGTS